MATPTLGNPNYPKPEVTAPAVGDSPTIASYLKRAFLFLEDGDWTRADEYCEKVLDIDPENPRAYLGKLMAQLQVPKQSLLQEEAQPFNHLDPFKKVIRFGDEALKATLSGYITHIIARNEETAYETGCAYMAKDTLDGYQKALLEFQKIPNSKGIPELTEECNQKIKAILKEAGYQNGCAWMAQNTLEGYQKALAEFQKIPGYKDSKELAKGCLQRTESLRREKQSRRKKRIKVISLVTTGVALIVALVFLCVTVIIPNIKYNNAVSLMESGKYDEAITAFLKMDGYKDSRTKISDCKYAQAVALMEAGKDKEAIAAFEALGDYPGASTQLKALRVKLTQRETVSAGVSHTVGLKANGTVVAAGDNIYSRCTVSGWKDIIAVSAGAQHTVGLKRDGTVVATGKTGLGQCKVSDWTGIIAVSAGGSHTVGLKPDGTVVAVGLNNEGQCNVSGWTNIIAVSAGSLHTVGLKADGTVVATGNNNSVQCNVTDWTDIVAVSAGNNHTVGLKADGTVIATGNNAQGQCNVTDWTDIIAISAGNRFTVGLKADGTVVAVGLNSEGQCDISGWNDIVAITASDYHTVGLKADGTVVATGDNDSGQCNVTGWSNIKKPE